MEVGSLSGTSGTNALNDIFKVGSSGTGNFRNHTVTIGDQSVVSLSEMGNVFLGGKSLLERQVSVVHQN